MAGVVAGWIGAVMAVFIVITRPWRGPAARAPLALLLAALLTAWCFVDGAFMYQDAMARGAWTAATLTIPYVPIKALLFAVLGYALGRTVLDARASVQPGHFGLPAAIAVVLIAMLGADVAASVEAFRIHTARAQTLTAEQIAGIVDRINTARAYPGEIETFLENPLCPPELLQRYATKEANFRLYVARNPRVPSELIVKLSQDADAQVRYSAVYNRNLPSSELPRMAMDADPMVREGVAWKSELRESDFARLVADAEPRVRAAAALQPRISDDALLRLTEDSDTGVRANATRIAVQRGLKY